MDGADIALSMLLMVTLRGRSDLEETFCCVEAGRWNPFSSNREQNKLIRVMWIDGNCFWRSREDGGREVLEEEMTLLAWCHESEMKFRRSLTRQADPK